MPSDGCSNSMTRILRAVGYHPTRGWIHGTAFTDYGEHAKPKAAELRSDLFAQGCVAVSLVVSCRVFESSRGLELLAEAKARTRIR